MLPSQAAREYADHTDLVLDVMEVRAYVAAYRAMKAADSEGDVPQSTAADWVWKIQRELGK